MLNDTLKQSRNDDGDTNGKKKKKKKKKKNEQSVNIIQTGSIKIVKI